METLPLAVEGKAIGRRREHRKAQLLLRKRRRQRLKAQRKKPVMKEKNITITNHVHLSPHSVTALFENCHFLLDSPVMPWRCQTNYSDGRCSGHCFYTFVFMTSFKSLVFFVGVQVSCKMVYIIPCNTLKLASSAVQLTN